MKSILKYKSFFAYSEKTNKSFFTEFKDGINIVYGRNTSGKSTLIQSILYTFGINDVKTPLTDILDEKPIFRLDFVLLRNGINRPFTFIREDENIYVKQENEVTKSFFGISGNSSAEHTKLKNYLYEIFNFNLCLQKKDSMVQASIETIFLPYYISQSTGWVYLRKSFNGLEYYKNFKIDYLDYYLAIENDIDRADKQLLEKEKETYTNEIKFYNEFEVNNTELTLTKMVDESFINKANNYIESFQKKQDLLVTKEKEYIDICNQISFYTTRISVLSKVKKNHLKQNPENSNCPVCHHRLNSSIEAIYEYHQDLNDTVFQLTDLKEKQKKKQGTLNTLNNKIQELKIEISNEYDIVKKYEKDKITFDKWLDNKTNSKLINNIELKLVKLNGKLQDKVKALEKYKTDDDILGLRKSFDIKFSSLLKKYLIELEIISKSLNKDKFTNLYDSTVFPMQGVELHKAILAHNFAFNKIINDNNKNIHRLPFLIDAIFKEDIDGGNKKTILDFVHKNRPLDTQTIISIAYKDEEDESVIHQYNKEHFNNEVNLICIGNATKTQAFLSKFNNTHKGTLEDTLSIIYNI